MQFRLLFISSVILLLTACTSNSLYHKVLNAPEWLLSPNVDDGLAVSSCVPWSGNYRSDKELAGQKSKQASLIKLKQSVVMLDANWVTDSDVKSMAKVVNEGRVIRVDFAEVNKVEQLCTLWFVDDAKLTKMIKSLAQNHQASLDDKTVGNMLKQIKQNKQN